VKPDQALTADDVEQQADGPNPTMKATGAQEGKGDLARRQLSEILQEASAAPAMAGSP